VAARVGSYRGCPLPPPPLPSPFPPSKGVLHADPNVCPKSNSGRISSMDARDVGPLLLLSPPFFFPPRYNVYRSRPLEIRRRRGNVRSAKRMSPGFFLLFFSSKTRARSRSAGVRGSALLLFFSLFFSWNRGGHDYPERQRDGRTA